MVTPVVALLGRRLPLARKRVERREERPDAVSECRVVVELFHAFGLHFSEACTRDSQECDSVLGILCVSPGTQYHGPFDIVVTDGTLSKHVLQFPRGCVLCSD